MKAIALPDLSERPFRFTVERAMKAPPKVLYRAWTEEMDQWFAAPGTALMRPEVNAPFFGKPILKGSGILTMAGSSGWSAIVLSN